MHIYIFMYVHIYACIYVNAYTYIHTLDANACTSGYTFMHSHKYMHIYIYTYMNSTYTGCIIQSIASRYCLTPDALKPYCNLYIYLTPFDFYRGLQIYDLHAYAYAYFICIYIHRCAYKKLHTCT